jgi:hypothetical protein
MPLVKNRARCGPDSTFLNGRWVLQLVVASPGVTELPPKGALFANGLLRSRVPVEHNSCRYYRGWNLATEVMRFPPRTDWRILMSQLGLRTI